MAWGSGTPATRGLTYPARAGARRTATCGTRRPRDAAQGQPSPMSSSARSTSDHDRRHAGDGVGARWRTGCASCTKKGSWKRALRSRSSPAPRMNGRAASWERCCRTRVRQPGVAERGRQICAMLGPEPRRAEATAVGPLGVGARRSRRRSSSVGGRLDEEFAEPQRPERDPSSRTRPPRPPGTRPVISAHMPTFRTRHSREIAVCRSTTHCSRSVALRPESGGGMSGAGMVNEIERLRSATGHTWQSST